MGMRWVGSLELMVDDATGAILVQSIPASALPIENENGPIDSANPLDVKVRNDGSERIEVRVFDANNNAIYSSNGALNTSLYDVYGSAIYSSNNALRVSLHDTYGASIYSNYGALNIALFDASGNPIYSSSNALRMAQCDGYGSSISSTNGALYVATYDAYGSPIYSSNGGMRVTLQDWSGNAISTTNGSLYSAMFDAYGYPIYSTYSALHVHLRDGNGNGIVSYFSALGTTLINENGSQINSETNEFGLRGLSVSQLNQVSGNEGNLASGTPFAAGDESGSFTIDGGTITVMGHASAATTLSLLLSAENATFYVSDTKTLTAAGDFCFHLTTAARFCRLRTSSAVTLTATVLSRR